MSDNVLQIQTGNVRLRIVDDRNGPERFLEFNPNDIVFAEKIYALEQQFSKKRESLQSKADQIDSVTERDEFGLYINTGDRLAFVRELSEWLRDQIDDLFGQGTSQSVFGDIHEIEVYEQFFSGIQPYFKKARSEKVDQYRKKVLDDRRQIEQNKASKR